MYNKIFTKILDSSIWLEPDATRIVWLTCIAAMDEDGFCMFASPANLAHRANVTLTAALAALETLEGPDANSSDHDNEGRRLERVPGGWMVLNAAKYRELVSRELAKVGNRRRVQRHRESKRASNGAVTHANESVTLSEAEARSETDTKAEVRAAAVLPPKVGAQRPLPHYRRLKVFPWMLDEMLGMLGDQAFAFDLDKWLLLLDQSGDVLPAKLWPWLKERVSADAAARGLAHRAAGSGTPWEPFVCPHSPECHGRAACALRTQLDAMKAGQSV